MQLRSLALPFTVLEWTLPTVPPPVQTAQSRQSAVASVESATSTDSSEKSTFDFRTKFIHSLLEQVQQINYMSS